MNVIRLQRILVLGLLFLWVILFGCLLLIVVGLRVLDLMLGLCMSRSLGLHNQYIHSFNIIDGL